MTRTIGAMVERLAASAPEDSDHGRRMAAVEVCAAMVGALILSRAVDDPALADELLAATRQRLTTGHSG
jgi:TetR/AcrR family transcriptional repressor of nem operon